MGIRIILLVLCALLPATANAATRLALWDFEDTYANNGDATYNLNPGGSVPFVPSRAGLGMAVEFHGGTFPITSSPPPSNPALDHLDTTAQPTNASFNAGLSIMGWVKPHTLTLPNTVLSHDSSSYDYPNALGFALDAYQTLEFDLRDAADNRFDAIADGSPLSADVWHHIAATWDGSPTGVALYIDGQPVSYHTLGSGFQHLNSTDPLPIRVGGHLGNADNNVAAFDGDIDHLSLYSGALTAAEVLADSVPEPSCGWLIALCSLPALLRRGRRRNGLDCIALA